MRPSIYQLSVPAFLRGLEIAFEYCQKASSFCEQNELASSAIIDARLAPDMLTFAGQIQRISDGSKGPAARLAAIQPPSFEDKETTFPELFTRIEKTAAFLKSIDPTLFEDAETRTIEARFPWGGGEHLDGQKYLMMRALPNFYFHIATAHGILRHCGVPLGKVDYLYLPEEIIR